VYDLTKFVDKHPGGSKIIAVRAGRKADKTFVTGNHPPRVMEKSIVPFRIGSIRDESMI
jgi:cytochrome b involved in lipid metabolism